jgi:hypothetical protein
MLGKNQYSNFDAIGSFSQYYNNGKVASIALPLDAGTAIPSNQVDNFVNDVSGAPKPKKEEAKGFWHGVGKFLNDAYNFASHTVTFAIELDDPNSPYRKNPSLQGIKSTWNATRGISPGEAAFTTGARYLSAPFNAAGDLIKKTTNTESTAIDEFIKGHFLPLSSDFNVFDKDQRYKAYGQQSFGKIGSWIGDFAARWYIDPTIIGGKAIKAYKAGAYTLKAGQELKGILTKAAEGTATRQEKRVAGTFNNFLKATDGMNESELFRIRAIRESSNPGVLANLIADANRLHADDLEKLHQTKADIIHMAMGDANAYKSLLKKSETLAGKIGALNMEVAGAKHLDNALDELGNPVFEELANGFNLEKTKILIKNYETKLDDLHKKIQSEAVLNSREVPYMDALGKIRRGTLTEAHLKGNVVLLGVKEIKAGPFSGAVKFFENFAYKRPKGWIDFKDNQSVQTVDNLLNRVMGMSAKREQEYLAKIEQSKINIKNAVKSKANPVEIAAEKATLKRLETDFASAHFTVDRRNELFASYTNASTPEARSLAYQKIEEELFQTVAKQFGYTRDQVGYAFGKFASTRTKAINLLKQRSYSGATDPLTGGKLGAKEIRREMKDTIIPAAEDAVYSVPLPLNTSQLLYEMSTLDIDKMYQVLKRASRAEQGFGGNEKLQGLYKYAVNGRNRLTGLADELDQLLKFEVLARLGYPIRNVTEGSMRIMATVGPMILLESSLKGFKKLTAKGLSKLTPEGWFKIAHAKKLEDELLELETLRSEAGLDLAERKALDKKIAEVKAVQSGKMRNHPVFGIGTVKIRIDGVDYTIQDAKGVSAEQAAFINEKFINNASNIQETLLLDSKDRITKMLQNTGDFIDIAPTEPMWAENYLRVVNRIVRGNEITKRFLEGQSVDDVAKWLTITDEGQKLAKAIGAARYGDDAFEIARLNAINVNHLLPNEYIKNVAKERALTADDIKYLGDNMRDYPIVNGSQVSITNGSHSAVQMYNNLLKKFYDNFGQRPENAMTKSPLFVRLYRERMAASIEHAIKTVKGDTIPDAYMRNMEQKAREWARSEMRRNLYDLSEKTGAAHSLKYVFPFFGAFSDVAEKWGKIVIDDPSVLAKLTTVFQSPDRAGLTEERNGITYINLPSSWAKAMSLGYTDQVSIPKTSLNLLFQGGSWWNPGAGWFVQAAASKIVMHYPKLEDNKYIMEILPYGAQDKSIKDLLVQSPAARKLMSIFDASDPTRAALTARIMAEEMTKFENGQRDTKPTRKEINDRTRRTLAVNVASRLVLPFATNVQSPFQFYIDEFHRFQSEDPMTANEKFYDAYGDAYFNMSVSLSKNNTGINATQSADAASKKYADIISENPEYGWLIVGPDNAGAFSPTVFAGQKSREVSPGSSIKQREQRDPFDAFNQTLINKGWIQYRKGSALIDSMRISMGLTSLNSVGAEFLQQQKQALTDAIAADNPAWFKSKSTINTAKVTRFLNYAAKIVDNPRLADRPDIQSLKKYLQGRQMIQGILQNRPSSSLNNNGNFDIKQQWFDFVGMLISNDVTFGDIHSRILENDDLSRGA